MLRPFLAMLLVAGAAAPLAAAQPARRDNPQIDFAGFRRLATEVEPYRRTRLVDWAEFDRLRGQQGVLILDARSESAFRRGHISGAVNLPFTDFTAESLAQAIGRDRDRPILIYCNNNFSNNRQPVMLKSIQLALNIQTFINLVGYGYRNVRELNDVIDFNTPEVRWVRG
jgi:rhodanese-related sulfurtransferase